MPISWETRPTPEEGLTGPNYPAYADERLSRSSGGRMIRHFKDFLSIRSIPDM